VWNGSTIARQNGDHLFFSGLCPGVRIVLFSLQGRDAQIRPLYPKNRFVLKALGLI
jgi:hypothetical protein